MEEITDLKRIMKERKLSLEDVARGVDMSPRTVSCWLTDWSVPSVSALKRLRDYLRIFGVKDRVIKGEFFIGGCKTWDEAIERLDELKKVLDELKKEIRRLERQGYVIDVGADLRSWEWVRYCKPEDLTIRKEKNEVSPSQLLIPQT